ncbi:MAG: hypothetical protein F6K16_35845, partial [Symploca sp. SIO2B6]|nr:hypothetical protein [Symploca sp. SIO2B6]
MFRHSNLFVPPKCFKQRLEELKSNGLSSSQSLLLLQVELGFALMEYLHLDDEPVVSVWAILSSMPIRHPRLQMLTDKQRRAIANARQLIPYAARFAWRGALTDYLEIDVSWRNYKLVPQYADEPDDQLDRLNDQIIAASKQTDHQANQSVYDYCLTCQLEFNLRECGPVEANVTYKFEAKTEREILPVSVSFAESHINTAMQKKL